MYFLGKTRQRIIFDFIKLYFKCMFTEKLNYYDKELISIIDEYDYILEYKKEWRKRYD